MGTLLVSLKEYLENTPKEELDKTFESLSYLNDIGPEVKEYEKSVKEQWNCDLVHFDWMNFPVIYCPLGHELRDDSCVKEHCYNCEYFKRYETI